MDRRATKYLEPPPGQRDAAGGGEARESSRQSSRSSSAIVAELSAKLAKQRKMLDELAAQKAQTKSTWKWWQVPTLVFFNNLLAVGFGWGTGSIFFGVGRWGEGWTANQVTADGLLVSVDGQSTVLLERPGDVGHLVLEGGEHAAVQLQFGNAGGGDQRCAMETSSGDVFSITLAGKERVRIQRTHRNVSEEVQVSHTDILLNTPGAMVVGGDLGVDGISLSTRSSSLRLVGRRDIVLDPAGSYMHNNSVQLSEIGTVRIGSNLDVATRLSIREDLLVVDTTHDTVHIGTRGRPAHLSVHGVASGDATLQIESGFTLREGDIRFGDVPVGTQGDFIARGSDITLGIKTDARLSVRGDLNVINPIRSGQSIISVSANGGDIGVAGSLRSDGESHLMGDTILGSRPTDTVVFDAMTTQLLSLRATGAVTLGDDDDDTVTVYGRFVVTNDNGEEVFNVLPLNGNAKITGTLAVTDHSKFDGSADIGAPGETIDVYGTGTFHENVTAHKTVEVVGDSFFSAVYASNLSLSGNLQLANKAGETTFRVEPSTGDVHSEGSLYVAGDASFSQDIVLGLNSSDLVEYKGAVSHFAGPLHVDENVRLERDVFIERALAVSSNASLNGDLIVQRGAVLGGSSMQGDLLLQSGPGKLVFYVKSDSGDTLTEGSLRVVGKAHFGSDVHIDSIADIHGRAIVHADVDVSHRTSIGGALMVGGNVDIGRELFVADSLQVRGDAWLGHTGLEETTVKGTLAVLDDGRSIGFSAKSAGDMFVRGGVSTAGPVTLAGSTVLGGSGGSVTVHSTSLFRASMQMSTAIIEDTLDVQSSSMLCQGRLVALSDTVISPSVGQAAVQASSGFHVANSFGTVAFMVNQATGDVQINGHTEVHGDVDVQGHVASPDLRIFDVAVDGIRRRPGSSGVTIEGVLFSNGQIGWNKVHEIKSTDPGRAVLIDEAQFEDGRIELKQSNGHAEDADILTLTNTARSLDSATGLAWTQTYHHGSQALSSANSTALLIGMSDVLWTEDPQTHNSYMSFISASQGTMAERMRITPSGDVHLNSEQSRIVLHADGDVDVAQNVVIGGGADPSGLTVQSHEGATLRLRGNGGVGSQIVLNSPYGAVCGGNDCLPAVSTFTFSNVVAPPMVDVDGDGDVDPAPMLQISSGGSSMLELTDLGGHATLRLSGNYEIGTATSTTLHTFLVQSGAAAEILVDSSTDAAVVIQSGNDKQAQLVLVDPAKDGEGNSFAIINDGGENRHKNLLFADGDGNTMMRIEDKGASGDLLATGDGVVGSMHVDGARTLTVQSSSVAEINVLAGSQSDALLKVSSGPDRQASVVFVDPASLTDGSRFHIVNVGDAMDYPTMRITDGTYEMMSLLDKGDTGDVLVTGSGLVGGPSGEGERVLQIESATEALMNVHSTATGSARSQLISGSNQNAKLVLTDPSEVIKSFEVFNEGGEGLPTLTFCAMSPCETKLMQIVRQEPVLSEGRTGDFIVNGNALLGGPDAVGTRTLRVVSGHSADLKVVSRAATDAQVVIQSGPDMDSKLALVDPGSGSSGSIFEVVNRGAATIPTLEITDGENTLLSITDQGTIGDLVITGSGLFGGSNVLEDRTLRVRSGMQARLDVLSGTDDDAVITVTAGVDKRARVAWSGAAVRANSNHFELVLDGSDNTTPGLTISDGIYDLLTFVDKGDGAGDILVSGDALIGPAIRSNACVEAALISVPADAAACAAITDLDTPDACALVLTDDLDDGAMKACSYISTLPGPRLLAVKSGEQSSVDIRSGDDDDASVKIMSGVDKTAQLVFKDAFSDAQFVVHNDGDENEPTFRISHGADPLISIIDRRNSSPGDLLVTGSGTFGMYHNSCRQLGFFDPCGSSCVPRATCRHRTFTVQSSGQASVSVTSVADASVVLSSGNHGNARVALADITTTSDGTSGSLFEIYNDGFQDRKQLLFSDGTDALLSLVDQHDTALLKAVGSATFGLPTKTGDQVISVMSGGTASVELKSAADADSYVTIAAGPNSNSVLGFIAKDARSSHSDSAINSIFEIKLAGAATLAAQDYSALEISDGGTEPIVRILDRGSVADLELAGTLECVDLVVANDVILGNDLSDQVQVRGHVAADLVFDANRDGNRLTLVMTDPAENTQITFPDETGTVLTSVSTLSRLTAVGELDSGSIAVGFGAISTSNNIETVGTERAATCTGVATDPVANPSCADAFAVRVPDDSHSACPDGCDYTASVTLKITVREKVTAASEFRANADVYLGDSAGDTLLLHGLVATDLTIGFEFSEAFGPEIDLGDGTVTQQLRDKSRRITFLSDVDGSKQTFISARFNPTTIDSPPGERLITIPDVPSGGSIHVVSASYGKVQTGSQCSTPNCLPVVQGRTPGTGTIIRPNEVLMDVTAGYILGPSGLAAGAEEQIGLINRLIKPHTLLIANIADYGSSNGRPYVSAVAVAPGGGRATIVVRNIHPTESVTVSYKVAWSLFN